VKKGRKNLFFQLFEIAIYQNISILLHARFSPRRDYMKNIVEGIVFETHGSKASVRISIHGNCTSCGSCGGGGMSIVTADNAIQAKEGQSVMVQTETHNANLSAFVVYLLPLLSPIAGYSIGYIIAVFLGKGETILSVSGAVVFFAVALFFIKKYDKKVRASSGEPVIISIKN
jgi:sigma-E factor negative regulatory protein RseC